MLLYWGMVTSEFLVAYGVSFASSPCAGYTATMLYGSVYESPFYFLYCP